MRLLTRGLMVVASSLLNGLLVAIVVAQHTTSYGPPPVVRRFMLLSVFDFCGRPCVVKKNMGGDPFLFIAATDMVRKSRKVLVIDGDCFSACAYAADWMRQHSPSQVCITTRAIFGFHKARLTFFPHSSASITLHFDPWQSPEVDAWVKKHKGYPKDYLMLMEYPDTKKFWHTCELNPPLPRRDPRKRTAAK